MSLPAAGLGNEHAGPTEGTQPRDQNQDAWPPAPFLPWEADGGQWMASA